MGVKAHAKLLLMGEHAAVYGSPAVGVGLPWTLEVDYAPGTAWDLPGLGAYETPLRNLLAHFQQRCRLAGRAELAPGRLGVTTQVPLGSGFGSSGALCAALARLFFPRADLDQLDHEAWEAEKLFHGTPSGIDTVLALRPGWWALLPGRTPPQAQPLSPPRQTLVLGAVRRQGDTKALVGGLAQRRQRGEALVVDALTELGELAQAAIDTLSSDGGTLPGLVNRARQLLRSLGLESAELASVLDAGLGEGALAGKLSGAGGGGAWFLLFDDPLTATAALPALRASVPAHLWTLEPCLVTAEAP
ncbi:MAG: hypothetical protein WCG80_09990 [Spirochaetales bacterium]